MGSPDVRVVISTVTHSSGMVAPALFLTGPSQPSDLFQRQHARRTQSAASQDSPRGILSVSYPAVRFCISTQVAGRPD